MHRRPAKAAAEEEARADDEELRQLQERATKAKARRGAALAETTRIEAEAKLAAAEAERSRREQAKRAAAREAHDAERAAFEAEAANRSAAKATATIPARAANTPTSKATTRTVERRPETRAATAEEALTPLAALFQEPLTEVKAVPATTGPEPTPRRKIEPPAAHPARPVPAPLQADGRQPVVPATPPPAPTDDLPPLAGADLTSFRTWLGVSQRALAARLGVEQSSISKGEGRATTILAPHLRKALHLAMQEPRDAARGRREARIPTGSRPGTPRRPRRRSGPRHAARGALPLLLLRPSQRHDPPRRDRPERHDRWRA